MTAPKILNLSSRPTPAAQRDEGAYDLPPAEREKRAKLLARSPPISAERSDARAEAIATLAEQYAPSSRRVMIGSISHYRPRIHRALIERGLIPVYASTKCVRGSLRPVHRGFVEPLKSERDEADLNHARAKMILAEATND